MGRKSREKKEQQRQYVERLLESDLSVAEWCDQYGIAKQTVYAWVSSFAETEPELFGGAQNIVDRSKRRWLESTRLNIRATKQLAVRPAAGVVIVDTLYGEPAPAPTSHRPASQSTASPSAISIDMRGASVHIPPGSAESDISTVLKAVARL
jgi:transposase-like protein